MIALKNGDRVYHKNLQEFGILTEVSSSPCSSIVLFDDSDELEVTSSLLVKVLSEHHENLLKETYDL